MYPIDSSSYPNAPEMVLFSGNQLTESWMCDTFQPSMNGSCARFPGDIIAVILVIIELRYEFLCASLKLGGDLKLLIEILLVLTHRARQAVVGRGR